MTRILGYLDWLLHKSLDGYINRQLIGWGLLQLGQNRLCNAYERRADTIEWRKEG